MYLYLCYNCIVYRFRPPTNICLQLNAQVRDEHYGIYNAWYAIVECKMKINLLSLPRYI